MKIECDPNKNHRNIEERGLPYEHAADFDFETALVWEDVRKNYPERRFVAIGFLEKRLHVLVFSLKPGSIRVISFRKANPREVKTYEKAATPD